jgi:plastocyanin
MTPTVEPPVRLTAPTISTTLRAAAAASLLALGLSACGGGSSSSSSSIAAAAATPTSAAASTSSSPAAPAGSAQTLVLNVVESSSSLAFDRSTLTAKAGTVTIELKNGTGDQMPHAIAITGNGADAKGGVVQPGGDSTVTADLKPGTYTYYCPVGQHEKAGMKGTLTVS